MSTRIPQPLLNYIIIQGRRKMDRLKRILRSDEMSRVIDEFANDIASELELDMCSICIRFRETLKLPKPQHGLNQWR
ncbi:MAG: hypothetical protein QXJ95_06775 [Ignisphaera sp.]|uniref:Uncharacterized protein n=1 Tax=Ignisphaera aggregans TaxID=334771 RepID=A0A7J3JPD6_9CREN